MHNTRTNAISEMGGPVLPGGTRIGYYSVEDGRRVWTRRVSLDRHCLRIRDAWTINRPLVDQLCADGIDIVRYVTAPQTYELDLVDFLDRAEILPHYACGEDVFALPRAEWASHSGEEPELLPLFIVD